MPKVTFTVELDADNYMDASDGDVTISQWFKNAVHQNIHLKLGNIIDKSVRDKIEAVVTSKVPELLDGIMSERFENILNEDRSYETKDGWNTKKFVGTLDDFIAMSIEKRLNQPVDSNGNYLRGCTSTDNQQTWVQWLVGRKVESRIKAGLEDVQKKLDKKFTAYIDTECRDRSEKLLEAKIRMKLAALGVISEEGAQ